MAEKIPLKAVFSGSNAVGLAEFEPTDTVPEGNLPDASESVQGVAELATNAEARAGTDTTRVITPANLAAVLDGRWNKNFFINGGCRVNQRVSGAGSSLVKDAWTFPIDRFQAMATGTAVSAGAVYAYTASPSSVYSGHSIVFLGVTTTGAGVLYARYRMEALTARCLSGLAAISFSCRTYHNAGSPVNYRIYAFKPDAADNFAAMTAISNSGPLSVPTGTMFYPVKWEGWAPGDCSTGLEIWVEISCGAVTVKDFDISDFQLEIGSMATPFVPRIYAEDLALCQRFYQNSFLPGTAPAQGVGTNKGEYGFIAGKAGAAAQFGSWPFAVPMRVPPGTFTLYSPNAASGEVYDQSGGLACTGTSVIRSSNSAFTVSCTGNAGTAVGNFLAIQWAADAEF